MVQMKGFLFLFFYIWNLTCVHVCGNPSDTNRILGQNMKKKKEERNHNPKLFTSKWYIHESEIEVLKVGYHKLIIKINVFILVIIIIGSFSTYIFQLANLYLSNVLHSSDMSIHRPTSKCVPIRHITLVRLAHIGWV